MRPQLTGATARARCPAARAVRSWRARRRAERERQVDELVAAALRAAGTDARPPAGERWADVESMPGAVDLGPAKRLCKSV